MQTTHRLDRLRGEIDRIDEQLLDLVERRLALCAGIAAAKEGPSEHLKLRPERQRAVIARLQRKARHVPREAIEHIWRELMAHSLQRQAPTVLLLWTDGDREQLLRLARERFGSAPAVCWADSPERALGEAETEEAIVILPCSWAGPPPEGLVSFDRLEDEGRAVANAIGRVRAEARTTNLPVLAEAPAWSPCGWREREARQMPSYPDRDALERVERRLAARPPLVELHDVDWLRQGLAAVADGRALLLQGGDCAESFREFSPEKVASTADLLLEMGGTIAAGAGCPVVHVARMAGQFAKPRSSLTELVDGVELPAYQGDGVNSADRDAVARAPSPERLLRAHDQAAATARLLWSHVPEGADPVFASHEALLLPYEQALTRYDERTDRWWASSGHMVWIGDRTRALGGAHVEFARGIANPIAVKCGPHLCEDELLRLIDVLDPENAPGRLTLIARLGRGDVADRLPRLMRATKRAGRRAIWAVDPMHGNMRMAGVRKTRFFGDIAAETRTFLDIAASEGVPPGGIHLELTGTSVTECLGGLRRPLLERDLRQRYLTACDPRLNPDQARDLASIVAEQLCALRVGTAKAA